MAGKTKNSEPKMRLDLRAKMYIVLCVCSLMLLVSVGIAFLLVGGFGSGDAASDSAVEPESVITESGYNKEENTIDTAAFSSTILPESSDAGQTYVDETLFLGDSNTARMYRMFDYCTYDNAIGSVGMSAKSLATYACVELNNSGTYVTMAKAVAGMQPKRVIITFGTNDLSPSYKAADFVKNYQTGIESIVEAYPSVDVIINAIPPLGQQHSNQSLTQTQVDEYNKARRNVRAKGLEVPQQCRGAQGFRHRLRQERLCGVERRHPPDQRGDGSAVHLRAHPQLHHRRRPPHGHEGCQTHR